MSCMLLCLDHGFPFLIIFCTIYTGTCDVCPFVTSRSFCTYVCIFACSRFCVWAFYIAPVDYNLSKVILLTKVVLNFWVNEFFRQTCEACFSCSICHSSDRLWFRTALPSPSPGSIDGPYFWWESSIVSVMAYQIVVFLEFLLLSCHMLVWLCDGLSFLVKLCFFCKFCPRGLAIRLSCLSW